MLYVVILISAVLLNLQLLVKCICSALSLHSVMASIASRVTKSCNDDFKMKEFQLKRSFNIVFCFGAQYTKLPMHENHKIGCPIEDDGVSNLCKEDCKTSLYNASNLFFFQMRW